jgi:hypothetical protein
VPERVVYLDNWGVTRHPSYPAGEPCLCGVAYGHPRFRSGDSVTTSPIRKLTAGRVITHSGTVYHLGKPRPNAVGDAFDVNREFSYMVIVLLFISRFDLGAPPPKANSLAELGPSSEVLPPETAGKDEGLFQPYLE